MTFDVPEEQLVNRRAIHLLWTVPLAAAVSVYFFFVAAVSLCGISGCSGGGFGVSTDSQSLTWIMCAVIGFDFAAAIAIPAWVQPMYLRVIIGGSIGLLIAVALVFYFVLVLTNRI